MKISVVMSAYNGEKYIAEQLRTILRQTRRPDEIVIIDDNSVDKTIEKIDEIVSEEQYKTVVRVIKNSKNLGWRVNFKEAILLATGDLIFCADQDDIWLPNKIEEMSSIMAQHPEIELLGAEYHRADMAGNVIEKNILHKRDGLRDGLQKIEFDKKYMVTKSLGCNICFTKNIQKLFGSSYWAECLPHDEFAWVMGTVRGTAWMTGNAYLLHREHGSNVSVRTKLKPDERLEAILCLKKSANHYNEVLESMEGISAETKGILRDFSKFQNSRYRFLDHKEWRAFLYMIQHAKYYYRWKAFAGDVVQAIGLMKQ